MIVSRVRWLIIGGVLAFISTKLFYRQNILVNSTINDKQYYVKSGDKETSAADTLATLENIMHDFADKMYDKQSTYPIEKRRYIKNLWRNCHKTTLEEADVYDNQNTYTINKGDKIVFCIRTDQNTFYSINVLTYVLLHEMAHMGNRRFGHGDEFVKIFEFFLDEAAILGLYKKIDPSNPEKYRGMIIA